MVHFPFSVLPAIVTALLLQASTTQASNILVSNDDGWAEINIRAFFNSLAADKRHSVVLSAPAENESGTGSSDAPATPLAQPCEFNSCPAGSPAEGDNKTDPRLNYVNSFPVTSVKYGINTLSPKFFKAQKPDIVVAGPNVGANLGATVFLSGTVGAANQAALSGIPGIAFSGATGTQTGYSTPITPSLSYVHVYAEASANLTSLLTNAPVKKASSDKAYLPAKTWLNVNYPASSTSQCADSASFKFVLSRILPAAPGEAKDVQHCGTDRLPTETNVVDTTANGGCYASVSVAQAGTKLTADARTQEEVLAKLAKYLVCLPKTPKPS